MTGVDMHGDILSSLLSALCEMTRFAFSFFLFLFFFFSIHLSTSEHCNRESCHTSAFGRKNYYKNSYLRVGLAVVVPSRAVHLIQRIRQTAQVKEKPEITGCTHCYISICIFMKDEKCKCLCSSNKVLQTVRNSNITLRLRMHYNVFHHLFHTLEFTRKGILWHKNVPENLVLNR